MTVPNAAQRHATDLRNGTRQAREDEDHAWSDTAYGGSTGKQKVGYILERMIQHFNPDAPMDLHERLVRGAREMLRWDQRVLATKAVVHINTVRRFEMGTAIEPASVEKLVAALVAAGIVFLPPGEIAGVSVSGGVALSVDATPNEHRKRVLRKAPDTDLRRAGVKAAKSETKGAQAKSRNAAGASKSRKRTTTSTP